MARNFKKKTEYLRVLITRIPSTKDNYNLKYVRTKRTIISFKSYNSLHKDKKSFLGNHYSNVHLYFGRGFQKLFLLS